MSVIHKLEELQKLLKDYLVKTGCFKSTEDVERVLLKDEYQILAANLFRSSNVSNNYETLINSFKRLDDINFEMEDISLVEKFENLINYKSFYII
ncbi:hypothetical protein J0A71_07g15430 [Encephalitozoon cuniculi]|nr:hypothetical protein J0A71_07g15430 [Encephalitozoon cuniculi]